MSCILIGLLRDASFWSNAGAPPFSWQTLASFGIAADARIGVFGYPY